MMKNISKLICEIFATCLYVGKINIMPGTFGSALAFLFLPFVQPNLLWLLIIAFIFVIGVVTSEIHSVFCKTDDPGEIIIDELVAQLLVFYFILRMLPDSSIYHFILSFMLFRMFDIVKPFPISFVDEKIKGGIGIMMDDLIAAIFAVISVIFIHILYIKFLSNIKHRIF